MQMLDLTDPRWKELKATYSNGSTVAKQLSALKRGELSKGEEENFWQELCHQDDSTESGYAAIPHLVTFAENAEVERALFVLGMSAHILCCSALPRSHRIPDFLRSSLDQAAQSGLGQLGELLVRRGVPQGQANTRAFLSAIAGFMKELELYLAIEGFDCLIKCPQCGHDFVVERLL